MTVIRIDPSYLRYIAQQLSGIADHLRSLGVEAQQITLNTPSYDGQFGPKARALGMEANARLSEQARRFKSLSEELIVKAATFEAVDRETLSAFDRLTETLQDWMNQAGLILSPLVLITHFPWHIINRYLRLGNLIEDPGDGGNGGDDDEWSPPWWSSLMVGIGEGWDRAVNASQHLSFISIYGLHRAAQASEDIIDASWFGFRRSMNPPDPSVGQLWLNGFTEPDLLSLHQYQYDGTELTRNDCATTSMAMVVNMALQTLGYTGNEPTQHGELAYLLNKAPMTGIWPYRVPVVGAMPPGRTAAALNRFAEEMHRWGYDLAWTAEATGKNTVDDLINNLQDGNPTVLFGVWESSKPGRPEVPHAMVLVGYDANTDLWKILDPGNPPDPATGVPRFREMNTAELEDWWGRRCPWYQRYTTVVLDIEEPPQIPPATPTAEPPSTPTPSGTETPTPSATPTPSPGK
jgi:hypothetical protein